MNAENPERFAESDAGRPLSDVWAEMSKVLAPKLAWHGAKGMHACVGCGLELDGDDPNDRCDECDTTPGQERSHD